MKKRVISSEEFIDRFIECLKEGKTFRLKDCIVEGDIDILDIYKRIKERIKDEKRLKELIEEKDEELLKKVIINVDINIHFFNVKFNGDFRMYGYEIYEIDGGIEIIVEFKKLANFGWSTFNGWVYFGETTFNGDAIFRGVTFNGRSDFGETTFNKEAHFGWSTFNEEADFRGATFNGKANFWRTTFNKETYFVGTIFNGKADFSSSTFKEWAIFEEATFKGEANFGVVIFNGETNFSWATFEKRTNFERATFEKEAVFVNSIFNKADFYNSAFKSRADFRDIWFNLLSFVDCTFEDLALFRKSKMFEKYEKNRIDLKKPNKQWIHTIINIIRYECLAIFLNTQFLNKHTKIENFPLPKTSFLKTDVREVMILCDIKKEEILSHKLLKIKENENREDKNVNLENKLKENAKGIYKEAYEILKNHLDFKSVLAEYRNLRISIENNRTYIEASNLYTMEMELIKEYSNNWFERSIIKAYKEISDYGESIEKTGKWIFCSIIVFTILASILRFKGMEWDIIEIIKFWFVSFLEVIRLFLQIGTDDKSLWILEPIVRVTSLILLGNLYIAIRRKLSRK